MTAEVKLAISTVSDGTMKRGGADANEVDKNRRVFLEKHGLSPEKSVLVQLDYDSDDFCRYDIVDETAAGEGMIRDGRIADALATQTKNLGLFLPLADCVGVVLYDPEHQALMLTHLGRHNLELNGGQKSVEFMTEQFGTVPADIEATFSPSAGGENYPLFAFDGKSLAAVAVQQLVAAGVKEDNIATSPIDTTKDETYFSHSEFLKGHRESAGRFAIVAKL